MANVTDPLARAVHGTDPQNLIEYIKRQKIYDSRYWKEECFGLNAVNVVEKAAALKAVGGCYGANQKPTHFLCLLLKLLQIQPDESIIQEILLLEDGNSNKDSVFKYVRALACMYLRLTGRPKDIYELLEPLYSNYSKLRVRTSNDWNLLHMDEYIDCLLTHDSVFGIALPRLAKRFHLEGAGYLDGPRVPHGILEKQSNPDGESSVRIFNAEERLIELASTYGVTEARQALEERRQKRWKRDQQRQGRHIRPATTDAEIYFNGKGVHTSDQGLKAEENTSKGEKLQSLRQRRSDIDLAKQLSIHNKERDVSSSLSRQELNVEGAGKDHKQKYNDHTSQGRHNSKRDGRTLGITPNIHPSDRKPTDQQEIMKTQMVSSSTARIIETANRAHKKKNQYGTLFKKDKLKNLESSSSSTTKINGSSATSMSNSISHNDDNVIPNQNCEDAFEEGSEEYWNQQRMKLGLKPLFK
jgi:pre-mRNA-splicing factor 38A